MVFKLKFEEHTYEFMFFVYIIYSPSIDQFYIGQSANLTDRIFRHNNSGRKSTKKANDWILKYKEVYGSR